MTTTGFDEFDGLLNDVLRSVANPELPERVRVRTRVYVQQMREPASQTPLVGSPVSAPRPAVVFAPEAFLAKMQPRRDARSTGAAVVVHAAAILLVFWAVRTHVQFAAPVKTAELTSLNTPPPMPPAKTAMGGGGGQRGATPVTKGQLPKFADVQITPPAVPKIAPKIAMPEPTLEVQKDLKMANSNLPNFGMPNSPLLGNSMGNGRGSGLGSGNGAGLGSGVGGNYGGGVRQVGGGVSEPKLIHEVEPEFSEEARKAKFMGNVLVSLVVDEHGVPQGVHVTRGVGMGLDEKAVDAVKQYRFRPATEGGKPVAVYLNVEVAFQIF